jgi:amino acid adenylation domain-containing protein
LTVNTASTFFPICYEFDDQTKRIPAQEISFTIDKQYACTERYELKLRCVERDGQLCLEFHYDASRFHRPQIERLASQFITLLESALAQPSAALDDLEVISPQERHQLLVEWNDTKADYPAHLCLHELFEQQVERSPESLALVSGEERLTYRELNERANQLAAHLRTLGVGPEVIVSILMERSLEMVVSLLAVLKAGGAYLPLDVSYPAERVRYMMDDAGIEVLLTHRAVEQKRREVCDGNSSTVRVVCVDEEREEIERQSAANEKSGDERSGVSADNLAYVIYTSGSTGRPKGVMIPHCGLVNYLHWAVEAYQVREGTGTLLHSPLGFDLTVTSIYAPLLAGRSISIVSETDGLEGLSHALSRSQGLSLLKVTPAHLEVLGQSLASEEAAGRTRTLIVGGEALLGEQLRYWQRNAHETRVINEYGPTETVVGCCVYEVKADESFEGGVPIGRPIANTQLYILDERMRPVGVGVSGELYIGGAGVGRGYLNRAELTAERFVPDPFGEEEGGRLYRTGDVARYRGDGEIEYVGRADRQVKVRGYRIELGEAEAELSGLEGVRQSAVEVIGEGIEKRLVGYVVMEEAGTGAEAEARDGARERAKETESVEEELRRKLRERVPEWMVPSVIVKLREMPLTANGKIDRSALPDANGLRAQLGEAYVAPRNEAEKLIANLWQNALRLDKVGIHDNFFDLGGHSLLMLDIHAVLQKQLKPELVLLEMFKYPTVASLAQYLSEGQSQSPTFEKVNERAEKQREVMNRQRRLNGRRRSEVNE